MSSSSISTATYVTAIAGCQQRDTVEQMIANPDSITPELILQCRSVMSENQVKQIIDAIVMKRDMSCLWSILDTRKDLPGCVGYAFRSAASHGRADFMVYLLNGAGEKMTPQDLETALTVAVSEGHLNVVITLFESGRWREISQEAIVRAHAGATDVQIREYLKLRIVEEKPAKKGFCQLV
jgi:hypothetical protein